MNSAETIYDSLQYNPYKFLSLTIHVIRGKFYAFLHEIIGKTIEHSYERVKKTYVYYARVFFQI